MNSRSRNGSNNGIKSNIRERQAYYQVKELDEASRGTIKVDQNEIHVNEFRISRTAVGVCMYTYYTLTRHEKTNEIWTEE